jgi:peptidyl-prolyl cis-trans isomerase SDCCAG10
MATAYNIEPLPTGRVLIKTSMGPLDVELFCKECSATCRSFIQLCMEGYYNNVVFHRIIKDFIIQTGDPTGTGTGGEAATPEGTVKDEFNSRLKYTRRGLVGMANSGEKDDNGSQFFVTLDATPELERKNTLFGRLAVGDTIFNALRIGNLETDQVDRPLYPPKILSTEVIENPFNDIVPRSTVEEREARQRQLEEEKAKATVKKAKKRNKALLSFEDDAEPETVKTKIKSVYDLEPTAADAPPAAPIEQKEVKKSGPSQPAPKPAIVDLTQRPKPTSYAAPVPVVIDDSSPEPPPPPPKPVAPKLTIEEQIASLKSELKDLKNKRNVEEPEEKIISGKKYLETEIQKYMKSGRAILGKRSRKTFKEDDTLSKLTQFQRKIIAVEPERPSKAAANEEAPSCELHNVPGCMSCFDRYGEQPDEDDPKSLWGHKLSFAKDVFGKDEKYRFEREGADLEVIDPREREQEFAMEAKRARTEARTKVFRQDRR